MNSYFDSKHLELYIPDTESGVFDEIAKLSKDELFRAIYAWSHYLKGRQTELPEVNIIESIWKNCLKDKDVPRFYGISYIYFQMCSVVAGELSEEYIKEQNKLLDSDLDESELNNL